MKTAKMLPFYTEFFLFLFKWFLFNSLWHKELLLFYSEILPELKNRPVPETASAICKKIIKVKNSFEISGIYFNS